MTAVTELTKDQERVDPAASARVAVQDCLFLALVVLLSLLLYVSRLGFYSDDWIFLSLLDLSGDQSLLGLFRALFDGDVVIRQRPVQMVLLVFLYRLFGLDPLGYHLANAATLVAASSFFYLVIREFRQSRLLALAVPLVYILLPHYSTDRFWVAAFQATLSIPFYFLSLYADLRAVRAPAGRWWRWKLLSAASLVVSGLSYEVTLPLFLLNPLLVGYFHQKTYGRPAGKQLDWRRVGLLFGGNFLALVLVVGFKALVTVRTNVSAGFIAHVLSIAVGAIRVNFGTYGLGLPYVVGWILFHSPSGLLLALSGVLGLLVFGYLYLRMGRPGMELPGKNTWPVWIGLGLLFFFLGYAVLVATADVWFTSASLGNRVAIAAAIGIAMTFTGVIGWTSSLLPSKRWRRSGFCLSAALLCVSGFMINNTLASFWVTAYKQQQMILTDIQEHVPVIPVQSTLILDAVCLEHGGAYLFTGKRDLGSIIRMAYDDPSLWATAITNPPRIEAEGLSILTYRDYDFFPYGEKLLLYNFSRKESYQLTDAESARRYFESSGFAPERDCPPGFAWGWNSINGNE